MATKRAKGKKAEIGIDLELIKVLGHPIRWYALDILNQRIASPKEIARELGEPDIGKVAYHVKSLRDKGFVELVNTAQRRGATEHYYKAIRRAFFTDEEWENVPASIGSEIVVNQQKKANRLFAESLEAGTFEARGDRHHSLWEGSVDAQGWSESMAVLERALFRVMEIQQESDERRLETDEPSIPLAVSMLGYEKAP